MSNSKEASLVYLLGATYLVASFGAGYYLGSSKSATNDQPYTRKFNNARASFKPVAVEQPVVESTSTTEAPKLFVLDPSKFPARPAEEDKGKIYDMILAFVQSGQQTKLFDGNGFQRLVVHELCEAFGISHVTKEVEGKRQIEISLEAPKPRQANNNNKNNNNNNNNNNQIDIANLPRYITLPVDVPINDETIQTMIQNQNTLYSLLLEKLVYSSSGSGGQLEGFTGRSTSLPKNKGGKGGAATEPKEGQVIKRHEEKMFDGIESTKEPILMLDDTNFRPTPVKENGTFRYVNWNIEWMEYIFESDTKFHQPGSNGINDVEGLCNRIANVIKDLNADIMCVLEGPNSIGKMQLFVSTYLDSQYTVLGGIDGADQRVFFLVRKDGALKNPRVHEESLKYLQKAWWFDVNGTCEISEYKFTRIPLPISCDITIKGENKEIFFFGTHTKSKFVAGGQSKWNSKHVALQLEFIKKSVSNRRRITGELSRLRAAVEKLMKKDADALIFVSGDLNDGPGMDFFEKYYLLHDSLAALIGSPFEEKRVLHSALLEKVEDPGHLFTCVFEDYIDNISQRKSLIDHILVSQPLSKENIVHAGVAHDIFLKYTSGPKRDEYPSDHRPVFSDFKI